MFTYNLTDPLKKRIRKLAQKDKVLALIFRRKITEVIAHSTQTISTYKNLRTPQHNLKRIYLTKSHVLVFEVDLEKNHIIFVDILHWDNAYT